MFRHGYTYSGHASACAVALANLDVIEREDLIGRVRELEPVFAERLGSIEGAVEVRSAGLVAAVQTADVERVVVRLRELGVLTRVVGGHSLQICPPFVITEDELELLVDRIEEAVGAAASISG
jgi:adenosylmethionine-8-amino-7-oxononanoate aminotransferase